MTQVKNDQQENTEQADVLALSASKVAEEQKEEEERNSARKEKEETEIQKKKEEEEMKEAKKDEEEQEKKTEVLPSVTVSQHTSGIVTHEECVASLLPWITMSS